MMIKTLSNSGAVIQNWPRRQICQIAPLVGYLKLWKLQEVSLLSSVAVAPLVLHRHVRQTVWYAFQCLQHQHLHRQQRRYNQQHRIQLFHLLSTLVTVVVPKDLCLSIITVVYFLIVPIGIIRVLVGLHAVFPVTNTETVQQLAPILLKTTVRTLWHQGRFWISAMVYDIRFIWYESYDMTIYKILERWSSNRCNWYVFELGLCS